MDFTPGLLEESKTIRDESITQLRSKANEEQVLNKVKALMFAVWKGKSRITREQLAEFYEVPVATIYSNYKRHKEEFSNDGVEIYTGKDLQELKGILPVSSNAKELVIYTAAGALRMGFILRDSEVAKEVRNMTIQIIQGIGRQLDNKIVLQSLIESHPILGTLTEGRRMKISSPFAQYWSKMKNTLKRQYPDGGIDGYSKDKIRQTIQFLSTYTNDFKLQGVKELKYAIAHEIKGKYPDLTSDIFSYQNFDGSQGKAVILFQFERLIIGQSFVESCIGRSYLQIAKESLCLDNAYLVFVAPFGVDSYAEDYIRTRLPMEHKGNVGVLTVKELANFLYTQAESTRKLGTVRGELKREFKAMISYDFPEPPVMYEQLVLDYQP